MSAQNKKTPKRQSIGPGTPKQGASDWKVCTSCDSTFAGRDLQKHTSDHCHRNGGFEFSVGFVRDNRLHGFVEDVSDHSCFHHLPSNEVSNLLLMHPATMRRCQIPLGSNVIVETTGSNGERFSAVFSSWPCTHLPLTGVAFPGNRTILVEVPTGRNIILSPFSTGKQIATEINLEILSNCNKTMEEDLRSRFLDQFTLRYLKNNSKIVLRYLGTNLTCIVRTLVSEQSLENVLKKLAISESVPSGDFLMISPKTQVKFLNFEESTVEAEDVRFEDIGGCEKAKEELKKLVDRILSQKGRGSYVVKAVLLHGPSGCGKTMLAKALARECRLNLVNVLGSELYSKFYGETEAKLKETFDEAKRRTPSLLLFDDIDSLCSRRDESSTTSDQERRVLSTLVHSLDDLVNSDATCFVLATTNRLDSLDPSTRGPRRLDREIEIGVPSSKERVDILQKKLKKIECCLSDEEVCWLGGVTHGFVGSDIDALIAEACLLVSKRDGKAVLGDFEVAMKKVKPSALREVQVEVPNVKWSDVGGQEKLKEKLKQAVEWPIKHSETLKRLGISSPKGLLMYGPPGCSKTLIAKALATESGLNFIAVKSSDLFSKYVGDSEKAVRDVFRRARQVAPSIIFFDEIDALAMNRSGGSSQGISVNDRVLAQLLTEMDGVTVLNDVQIIAATNRPDMIDKALMRPGRLDRVVYVPLPNGETRTAIFRLMLRKMAVSEDVKVESLVESTEMYSGAEVCAVCQEAGLLCLEENINATIIQEKHFRQALQIVRPRTTLESIQFYEKFSTESGFLKI